MSFARPRFLNRIGGQMAILIVVSLIAIHAVITTSLLLSQRDGWDAHFDEPGAFVTAVRMIAAAPSNERARVTADITRAFPAMKLRPAAAMPAARGGADSWLGFLAQRHGPGFHLAVPADAPQSVAVRLPDGAVFTARLP